jgi:thiol-disulfide isomerase/thioredoxin
MISCRAARSRLLGACAALLLLIAPGAQGAGPRPFDAHSLQAIRAAQAGKPFVLAFWSVHCPPCREELAHWGAWSRRHPGVRFVLVGTDGPEERELAASALARHDLDRVETWAFADAYAERLRWSVDPKWRGELPRTYFYDAGHRAEARSGRVDTAWVEAWLAKQGAGR